MHLLLGKNDIYKNIRTKWKDTKEAMTLEIANLESEIKSEVLSRKQTIKFPNVMAVWNKGVCLGIRNCWKVWRNWS